MSYFADQLTDDTPYFSGASTLTGTPGEDGWARVLGGQIGRLPEPLHLVDADCCLGLSQPAVVYSCTSLKNNCGYLKNKKKSRPTENTPRNPHQPSDRDHLETDRDETRPARLPMLARFRRSRVCGNRPRTALAISKNDECHTHTHTDRIIK